MKPYYYIFRVGGSAPRIKHRTLESAHTEAMRLATKNPGDSFEILQCLATTRTVKPQTFWMDGVIPPHVCAPSKSPTREELAEALRKAILWGECASQHFLYREKINWRYLEEARETLKAYSLQNDQGDSQSPGK